MWQQKCTIIDVQEKTTGCLSGLSQHQIAMEGKSVRCVDTEVYIVSYYNVYANTKHQVILQPNTYLVRGHQYCHVCCNIIFMTNQSHNKIAFITSLEIFQCLYCAVMYLPQRCI